ncbi:MAG: GIY-YIG nuclease family protein [Desulforhopalus sp.]|nr:GIY-YIG nuclease family protein [Desulforhopalus sp.]
MAKILTLPLFLKTCPFPLPMHDPGQDPLISSEPWVVYIVRCKDGSYYTGITTDLARRIVEHNSPKGGAKYTRPRRPVELVYSEPAASRAVAARREHQVKKMPFTRKIRLILGAGAVDAVIQQTAGQAAPAKTAI